MMNFKNSSKITISELPDTSLVHQFDKRKLRITPKIIIAIALIIVSGVLTGFLLSAGINRQSGLVKDTTSSSGGQKKIVGSSDTKTFKDSAEGVLETGGVDGEGTHRLVRPGGESQTVYLTSSVLDLGEFVGKKVKVWGETFSAKKAGWLMDVGKIEVL